MSKSSCLRTSDIHSLYQVAGECRDLGDDPREWRRHLANKLGTWTGAAEVTIFELKAGGHEVSWSGFADWGWETSGLDRAAWDRLTEVASRLGPFINPTIGLYMAALAKDDGVALTRADLIRDAEFYRSTYFQEYQRPTGADAMLNCFRSIPGHPCGVNAVVLARPIRVPDFGPRHRLLVREATAVITPLIGGPLARFTEPAPSDLTPRVREVLRCLLEGDGDKQIAVRLSMSQHTVNTHTKTIYHHFTVQSRAELLARWIRRGWGSRCAWTD